MPKKKTVPTVATQPAKKAGFRVTITSGGAMYSGEGATFIECFESIQIPKLGGKAILTATDGKKTAEFMLFPRHIAGVIGKYQNPLKKEILQRRIEMRLK